MSRSTTASGSRTHSREQFVEVALDLFWTKGYAATSMSDIYRRAESSAGNFYNYFAGKEELLLAVLEEWQREVVARVLEPAQASGRGPIEQLGMILDGYRAVLIESDYRRGCPLGRLALELAGTSPAVDEALRRALDVLRSGIARSLTGAVVRADSRAHDDGLPTLVLAIIEGALMQAQAEHSLAPFDAAENQLLGYLRSIHPAAA